MGSDIRSSDQNAEEEGLKITRPADNWRTAVSSEAAAPASTAYSSA
jgi:hypothetical protein